MKPIFKLFPFVASLLILTPSWCRAGDAASPEGETAVLGGRSSAPAEGEAAQGEKPKKKSKKKAKKNYDYDNSKYKAKVEAEPSVYRFNAKGEPVLPDTGKKSKKKKSSSEDAEEGAKSSTPSDEKPAGDSNSACADEAGCAKPE